MKLYYVLQEAIQALRSNALRSGLTIVGIVVGIFSVTAMLALGEGLSANIAERFDGFSSGDITINGDLTEQDLSWISGQAYVSAAMGTQDAQDVEVIFSGDSFSPTIQAALGDYETVSGAQLTNGQLFDFTDATFEDNVAVVDEGFVEAVQDTNGADATSGSVVLNGQRFEIVGVIEGGGGGFGRQSDGTIVVPYAAALGTVTATKQFSSIAVDLKDTEYYELTSKHLLEGLNVSRHAEADSEDYFSVSSAQDFIETAIETTQMISLFLGVVGGISLFVGGIGTMNMMLTTVTERTKEIGLRKAIGARDSDILLQILVESVTLTVLGGAIGIALTYGAAGIANNIFAGNDLISIVMSTTVVVYATLVSFVVGIVFGIYPARNASKLQPVDALRAD